MATNSAAMTASMYEILGVPATASQAELVAAHRRLSFDVMSGKLGLPREDCDARLQLLDTALGVLSDPAARQLHDRRLAAARSDGAALPAAPRTTAVDVRPQSAEVAAVAAVADVILRNGMAAADEERLRLGAISVTVGSSLRSLKVILQTLLWLFLLLMVMKMGGCVIANRQAVPPAAAVARAEEKLAIQAYFKEHGIRAASRGEVDALRAADARRENERRTEEFNERKAGDETERFFREASARNRREEEEKEYARLRAEEQARYEEEMRQAARSAPSARPDY